MIVGPPYELRFICHRMRCCDGVKCETWDVRPDPQHDIRDMLRRVLRPNCDVMQLRGNHLSNTTCLTRA